MQSDPDNLPFVALGTIAVVAVAMAIAFFAIPRRYAMPVGASGSAAGTAADDRAARSTDGTPSADDWQRGEHALAGDGNDDSNPDAAARRSRMVDLQLRRRDITAERVLDAMNRVPRHRFVPASWEALAYADRPLPIGHGQTISQPYIVALMTQLAQPQKQARALDIGTGSGYQAAVLAQLVDHVYSIEIVQPLADEARERLDSLGYENVTVRCGDGYQGWPEHAPFEVIIVAAAPDHVPQPLVDQLTPGGRLVIPVGEYFQELQVIEKRADGSLRRGTVASVAFVPMTGTAEDGDHQE